MGPLLCGAVAAVITATVLVVVDKLQFGVVARCTLITAVLAAGLTVGGAVEASESAFAESCPGLSCNTSEYTYGGNPAVSQPCVYINTGINEVNGSPQMVTFGSVDDPGPPCHDTGVQSWFLQVKQDLYKWQFSPTFNQWGWVLKNSGPWIGNNNRALTHSITTGWTWRPPNYYGSGYYADDAAAFDSDGARLYGGWKSASYVGWLS
jgi:hypothetical protein